jgi:SET domain-containing protein
MSTAPIRVGRSRTGLGLFAAAAIARGDVIAEYLGHRIPTSDANERERKHGARYMFQLDHRWTIDGSPRWNIARYANHACQPNAEAINDDGRIFLRAKRTIRKGEEITYDYGRAYVDLFFGPDGCRCASCLARRGQA